VFSNAIPFWVRIIRIIVFVVEILFGLGFNPFIPMPFAVLVHVDECREAWVGGRGEVELAGGEYVAVWSWIEEIRGRSQSRRGWAGG
jgi:hypothetical protein